MYTVISVIMEVIIFASENFKSFDTNKSNSNNGHHHDLKQYNFDTNVGMSYRESRGLKLNSWNALEINKLRNFDNLLNNNVYCSMTTIC